MAITVDSTQLFLYLLIGFGGLIGGFVVNTLVNAFFGSQVSQNMEQTTSTAVQSMQNMYTTYVNAMLAMHGAESLANHSDNHLVQQQKQGQQQTGQTGQQKT